MNCAHLRYFRLRLTDENGTKIDLKRIGGEGGLLDQPILEGTAAGGFNFKYDEGEILIPPSARADVVAEIRRQRRAHSRSGPAIFSGRVT